MFKNAIAWQCPCDVDLLGSKCKVMAMRVCVTWDPRGVPQRQRGRQLLLEAVHISGALLLALDITIPGPLRERTVVAHFRAAGGSRALGTSLNTVITLCADTSFRAAPSASFPKGSPVLISCHLFLSTHLPS